MRKHNADAKHACPATRNKLKLIQKNYIIDGVC